MCPLLDARRYCNEFTLPKFSTPGIWALMGVLNNDIPKRDKMSHNGLEETKLQSTRVYMMLQTVM